MKLRNRHTSILAIQKNDLEKKILSGSQKGLTVRNFNYKGRGVVTTREFLKNEFVVEYAGELLDGKTAAIREATYEQDETIGCYMFYFKYNNKQYCVDATAETDKIGRLINHSRNECSLVPRVVVVQFIPRIIFFAKQRIPCGVEIMFDYGDRRQSSVQRHPWLNT